MSPEVTQDLHILMKFYSLHPYITSFAILYMGWFVLACLIHLKKWVDRRWPRKVKVLTDDAINNLEAQVAYGLLLFTQAKKPDWIGPRLWREFSDGQEWVKMRVIHHDDLREHPDRLRMSTYYAFNQEMLLKGIFTNQNATTGKYFAASAKPRQVDELIIHMMP